MFTYVEVPYFEGTPFLVVSKGPPGNLGVLAKKTRPCGTWDAWQSCLIGLPFAVASAGEISLRLRARSVCCDAASAERSFGGLRGGKCPHAG